MKILKLAENKINQTINSLIEKNKQYAQNNRNKIVIKNHKNTIKECYEKIGKHYYNFMRSKDNEYLEELCEKIDQSSKIIERFKDKLIIDNNIKNHELKINELNCENDNTIIINDNSNGNNQPNDKEFTKLPRHSPIENTPNINIIENTINVQEETLNTQKEQENIEIQYPNQSSKELEIEQDNNKDINNSNKENISEENSNFDINKEEQNISLF